MTPHPSPHLRLYTRTISAKHQLSIPAPLARHLGWRPRQPVAIEVKGRGEIWVQKLDETPLEEHG